MLDPSPFADITRSASLGGQSVSSISNLESNLTTEEAATLDGVGIQFKLQVPRALNAQDSIEHADSFTGEQAVSTLESFLPTPNRKDALLLGRALEKARVFHHCTWEARLEDSNSKLYVLEVGRRVARQKSDRSDRTATSAAGSSRLDSPNMYPGQHLNGGPPPLTSTEDILLTKRPGTLVGGAPVVSTVRGQDPPQQLVRVPSSAGSEWLDDDEDEGYSPEDKAKLWAAVVSRLPALISKLSLLERESTVVYDRKARMWTECVPPSVVEGLTPSEIKRQEAIFELIGLQREFAEDLGNVKKIFMEQLRESRILMMDRVDEFIREVFVNMEGSLYETNAAIAGALLQRQSSSAVVSHFGDILLTPTARRALDAFLEYGKGQGYAKYWLDQERMWNKALVSFIESRSRLPELRRLPLESFMARPSTHLGRFPLLIGAILKYTPGDHRDVGDLEKFSSLVREKLVEINKEAGKAGNWVKLRGLVGTLEWKAGDIKDLRLLSSRRELVRSGTLTERRSTTGREVSRTLFLMDHLLLVTTEKTDGGWKVYRKVRSAAILSALSDPIAERYSVTFSSNTRPATQLTLFGSNVAEVESWKAAIDLQKRNLAVNRHVFRGVVLPGLACPSTTNLTSAAVIKTGGRDLVAVGTDSGVYIGGSPAPVKCIEKEKVTSLEMFPDEGLVALVAGGSLWVYPLSCVLNPDVANARKVGKQVSSSSTFIRAGVCDGKNLLCSVRSETYQSVVKVFEPSPQSDGGGQKKGMMKMFGGGSKDMLKTVKESDFYVPAEAFSMHFLKSKLCVGCRAGFELVDLSSLETRGLLDPNDESVEFVRNKESLRPLGLFRLPSSDVFLCYDNFGFFVNRHGARTRSDELIRFSGNPTAYSYSDPYLIAFDPYFIEIWNLSPEEPSELQQVIFVTASTALTWGEGRESLYSDVVGDRKLVKRLERIPGMGGSGGATAAR
ncbi:RHO1 GDP-GTP exchange protein 2 [Gonapodya sp. JEL0774]|nr:RHO1 GDP-GTP exchange protein 2 [Gonapodya sp. JEL0774]